MEDPSHRVQRQHTFGQPGAARVPDAEDRHPVGHRPLVGPDHDVAALQPIAPPITVASEQKATIRRPVDGADGGEHPRVVVGVISSTDPGRAGLQPEIGVAGGPMP